MSKIIEALKKLEVSNDNHWTAEGLPRLETVRFLSGDQSVTRDDITKAAPELTRQSFGKKEDPKPEPQGKKQPEPAKSVEELSAAELDKLITQEQAKLSEIQAYLQEGRIAHEKQQKVVDDLINMRHKSEAKVNPAHVVQAYLKSERANAQQEAEKLRALRESGITLEHLKDLLPKKSALDASFEK